MTAVATNLLGRWVKGRFFYKNKDYVSPRGYGSYSKEELKRLTEHQRTYWLSEDHTEQIIAVTCEGQEEYAKLRFWILVDGKPLRLEYGTVMPVGWTPQSERL